jgi:vanillate/3-O-methylgallate O-demethylase
MTDTAARQRQAYDTLLRTGWDAPFIDERPALFSPAATAQDDANSKGAFGRFAQLLPQEYADGWRRVRRTSSRPTWATGPR